MGNYLQLQVFFTILQQDLRSSPACPQKQAFTKVPNMKQLQWNIVYTQPDREKKVAELLVKKGLKAYCPLNNLQIKYGKKKKVTGEPVFCSYVFVCMDESQKSTVLQTRGVVNFVYWLNKPVVIENEEIAAINFFLQDYPSVTLEKIAINPEEKARLVNEPVMVRKGNVMEVMNDLSKVLLPTLGYAMMSDTRRVPSEIFTFNRDSQDSRIRV